MPKTNALVQLAMKKVDQRELRPVASAEPVASEPPSAHGSAPGLLLDVYLLDDARKKPTQPQGISLALFDDQRPPSFGYGAVLAERELEPQRTRDLGLHWTGSFAAAESGRHVFSFVVNHKRCKTTAAPLSLW